MLSRRALMTGLAATAIAAPAHAATSDILAAAMLGRQVPGMAALVIRNFQAEQEVVAGVRRIGGSDPIAIGDRWHLGSDGKAMTATLIARLVERGVLSGDAPLEAMLPGLASQMLPAYRGVTLTDLLSHRAGFGESVGDFDFMVSFVNDTAPMAEQRLRYIAAAVAVAPVGPPRGAVAYSNTGYLVAAAAAEQATGRDYEEMMRTLVFEPLRMRSPTYDAWDGRNELIGHTQGRVADQPYDPNPRVFTPSDGMRVSLQDWSRFCIDQMKGDHGDGRLLPQPNYRFLHTPQGDTTAALGWFAQPRIYDRQGPALFHSGSNGTWMAEAVLFPETGAGALVVANSAYGMEGNVAAREASRALVQTLSVAAP